VPSPGFSSTARAQAREILSRPPYKKGPDRTPRPLAGIFHALGDALHAVLARPGLWVYHHLLVPLGHGFAVSFGGWWPIVAGLLAVGAGVALGILLVRRRSRIAARLPDAGVPVGRQDPIELDSGADAAEAVGDHETAVRLRFRAGILRLASKGILADPDARTDRQLRTIVASDTFGHLVDRHERIVYGRDRASADDSGAAKRGWPLVLSESAARESARR
jgi:hypothetical protein